MLRIAIIVLLVVLAIRLVVRLAERMVAAARSRPHEGSSERPGSGPGQANARRRNEPRQIKQLAECPVCGTFFADERGVSAGAERVCSAACKKATAETTSGGG